MSLENADGTVVLRMTSCKQTRMSLQPMRDESVPNLCAVALMLKLHGENKAELDLAWTNLLRYIHVPRETHHFPGRSMPDN